jgi:N-acetylglutamate synthase-like GNAT family acetyltransferase
MIHVVDFSKSMKPAVLELILSIQREEFGFDMSEQGQPDLSDIPNFYQSGAGGFWVALADNEVVGTIALRDIGNNQGALRKMFVKATHRGSKHGVASALLEQLVRSAEGKGIRELYLGTTEKFLAAHRFYEKNGFGRVGLESLPEAFPRMSLDTRFYRRTLRTIAGENPKAEISGAPRPHPALVRNRKKAAKRRRR